MIVLFMINIHLSQDGLILKIKRKSYHNDNVDNKIKTHMDKMLANMYKAPGIGHAAPQVGINKRLIVIDTSPRPGLKRYQEEKIEEKKRN